MHASEHDICVFFPEHALTEHALIEHTLTEHVLIEHTLLRSGYTTRIQQTLLVRNYRSSFVLLADNSETAQGSILLSVFV